MCSAHALITKLAAGKRACNTFRGEGRSGRKGADEEAFVPQPYKSYHNSGIRDDK